MSIRDDLMALLLETVDFWDDDPGPAVDAILARYAVIELPEPHLEYGEDTPAVQWNVRGNGYALVRNDLTIVVGFRGAASPDEARQMAARVLAAALLAAANQAEGQS